MNRLRITLNNRKRFVFSAAMAAALVLLAGGANAGVPPPVTVHCVPKLSVNPSCADYYPTIQAAVNAANWGDAIFVGPGRYSESVTISTPGLSLLGAQAGNDARVDRHDRTKESIVDASSTGNAAFLVNADYEIIDGFTVTGGIATAGPVGIYLGTHNLPQVFNNIVEKNSIGMYVESTGPVISHNLFRKNNAGTGTTAGLGILTNGKCTYPLITENAFTGNDMGALGIDGASNAHITNNTSENDGAFVLFRGTQSSQFSNNHGKNFGHGGDPAGPIILDAAVAVGPNNFYLVISDNDLENGEAPISNGIAFTTVLGTTCGSPPSPCPNTNVWVTNNKIKGFPGNGIVAEAGTGPEGTLLYSWIVGNEVRDNGSDGIFIEGASVNNHNIEVFDNEAEGNHGLDCDDTTSGGGTLGTWDAWFKNTGNSSSPAGLCTPGRGHDHDWR
jgi:parallel beta-helix repeat protein